MSRKTYILFVSLFALLLLLLVRLMPRVEEIRPFKTPPRKEVIEVASLADDGKETLRDAVVEANKAQRPITILSRVSGTIRLASPLPTLLNERTTIRAPQPLVVGAASLRPEAVTWTIKGDGLSMTGLSFSGGGGKGVVILSKKGSIEQCRFEGFDTAVMVGGGHVAISGSVISRNKRGVEILEGARFAVIASNDISENREAGVWAVWPGLSGKEPSFLKLRDNRITGNALGVVLSAGSVEVDGNTVRGNTKGMYLLNAANIGIRRNAVYENEQHGIVMEGGDKNEVQGNTVYQNGIAGLLVNGSVNNLILGNQIFSNREFGLVEILTDLKPARFPNQIRDNFISDNGDGIYLMAASPVLKGNTIKGNRSSGLTIKNYEIEGKTYRSRPRLDQHQVLDRIER